jgi:hypothetical protein
VLTGSHGTASTRAAYTSTRATCTPRGGWDIRTASSLGLMGGVDHDSRSGCCQDKFFLLTRTTCTHTHTHAHRTQVHSPHPPRNQAPMMLATAPRWSIRGRQPQRMPSLAMQVPITLPTESVCFGACSTDMVTRERCEWKWLKGLGRTRQGWRLKHREGSTKHGCTTVNPTIRAMGRCGKHTVAHHGCRVDGRCCTHLVGRSGHNQKSPAPTHTSPKLGTIEKDANYELQMRNRSFL